MYPRKRKTERKLELLTEYNSFSLFKILKLNPACIFWLKDNLSASLPLT